MVKKTVSKGHVKKKVVNKKPERSNTEKILIENFVSLQKVLVNLSEKFDNLSVKISDLLTLFEDSAKTIVEKDFHPIDEKAKREISRKMDSILEQNKMIAKGLTLIHDTAKNPEFDYSIGTNPGQMDFSEPMVPKQKLAQPKAFVQEEPENKFMKSP